MARTISGIHEPHVIDAPVGKGIIIDSSIIVSAQVSPPSAIYPVLNFNPLHSHTVTPRHSTV